MNLKQKVIIGSVVTVIVTVCIYVFCKLEGYKREIVRLHSYHNNVIYRHEENISILFNRLNYLEAKQQDMTETVDRLDWLSKHRY